MNQRIAVVRSRLNPIVIDDRGRVPRLIYAGVLVYLFGGFF